MYESSIRTLINCMDEENITSLFKRKPTCYIKTESNSIGAEMIMEYKCLIGHCLAAKQTGVCLLTWELESEREKDHKKEYLSQPVGDSVWGEKSWGEEIEREKAANISSFESLLNYWLIVMRWDLRNGLQPATGSTSVASEWPHSLKHIFHHSGPSLFSLLILSISLSLSNSLSFRIYFFQRKISSRSPSAASFPAPCVSSDEFLLCVEDVKKSNTTQHNKFCTTSEAALASHWQPAVLFAAGIWVFIGLWK